MDKTFIVDLLKSLKFEAIRFRVWVVLTFLAVSFLPLVVGYLWPNTYTTEAVLYADETNIIEPLLKGRASVTGIDRVKQAQETLYTRRVMERAAVGAGLVDSNATDESKAAAVRELRNGLSVRTESANNFRVSYSAKDPEKAFSALNSVVNVFIQDTARRKREESVGAFNFIDAQVESYRRQLELAEEKLKNFRAQNTDGTEAQVSARINQLRNDIESLNLEIQESESRIASIREQLSQENQYQVAKGEADRLRDRRREMRRQLDQLLLSYQDSYPDVITLRQQIQDIDEEITRLEFSGESYGSDANTENPLYEELRKQLSVAEVNLTAQKRRMQSLEQILDREYARAERVAENQAQLSDLTRDLEVTRNVYNEMLERKESARLSMTLDIEGQGVNYRIQDPATFPLEPSGLRYIHFALVGPFLGFLAPLGLLFIYVFLDPHYRSARSTQNDLPEGVDLIGIIPHYHTPLTERLMRKDMVLLLGFSIIAMGCYIALGITWYEVKN
ncbi:MULTISPECIES: XrtA system polysaccharide chain length determinant [unclassified Marinimicrobium]|jgi:polysaccharide chain length determinant protein (PEP-CTERM system associated)|uniref:XrtA system polysaccharide chain length determinant n=1 Tax=unclassified Marinimicrobium TaxID=2632100 RepID=UPI000C474510|nr:MULTISPECIES: XrtA system polysaccharide chain length determinant [unclassified Marinimicrobium]MAN51416.1 chain length-determining protein [Marinimicrobium sp.]|tara:strand:+ start:233 stop:1747 length:1515 start_codon:yes stop_codon:yes gene_type:complete